MKRTVLACVASSLATAVLMSSIGKVEGQTVAVPLVQVPVLPATVLPSVVTAEYLLAFQAATLELYLRPDAALGTLNIADVKEVTRFNSSSVSTLQSTTPDRWRTVARRDWPPVRARIAGYNGLKRWVDQVDAMLQ